MESTKHFSDRDRSTIYRVPLFICKVNSLESDNLTGFNRRLVAVHGCRKLRKADLKLNDATPQIEVNPETYEVRADGELLHCDPAETLPLAQRYFLF